MHNVALLHNEHVAHVLGGKAVPGQRPQDATLVAQEWERRLEWLSASERHRASLPGVPTHNSPYARNWQKLPGS